MWIFLFNFVIPECLDSDWKNINSDSILKPNEGIYQEESKQLKNLWKMSFDHLVENQPGLASEKAKQAGYRLCVDKKNQVYQWSPSKKGWPWMLLRKKGLDLILETPHPIFDGTLKQGLEIFKNSNAKVLIISGTHRCTNQKPSGCSGTTTACSRPERKAYGISDPAHNDRTLFHTMHKKTTETFPESITISIHGMAAGGISLSDGTSLQTSKESFVARLADNLSKRFENENVTTCNDYEGATRKLHLCGSTNVQGRDVNGVSEPCLTSAQKTTGKFIHMEQSRSVRARGADVAEAIVETLTMEGHASSLSIEEDWKDDERLIAASFILPTKKIPVVENVHGIEITDNYRWLEDGESDEVLKWSDSQDVITRTYLHNLKNHEKLKTSFEKLTNNDSTGAPTFFGKRMFWSERKAGQNHSVLFWKDYPASSKHPIQERLNPNDGSGSILLNPNSWNEKGTTSLDWYSISPDGSHIAYGISENGDEKSTIHIKRVKDGYKYKDEIPYARWGSPAWLPDNSGFFYGRWPVPGTVPAGDEDYYRKIYFHKMGDNWQDDKYIFGEGRIKEEWPVPLVSDNGEWLIINAWNGWDTSQIFIKNLKDSNEIIPITEMDHKTYYGQMLFRNDAFYVSETSENSPNGMLWKIQLDSAKLQKNSWTLVLKPGENMFEAWWAGGKIVLRYMKKAHHVMKLLDPETNKISDIPLPGIGSIGTFSARKEQGPYYYSYTSFNSPTTIYRWDDKTDKTIIWEQNKSNAKTDDITVKQVEYESKDGTIVTMFVVHKKNVILDGKNPTYLYGYGGFAISQTPGFRSSIIPFLESGGIFALPNLRGGSEYGSSWHNDGMLGNKQNTFDDFIAAAEWLIENKYTNSNKIVISGGSNGGLLVGATMTQRPELFKAVVCSVPLLDMIRFPKFLIASLWRAEYGDPDKKEDFEWLHAYSPYHNVPSAEEWPNLLLKTADHDTRVDPLHARKFAALVQELHPQSLTLLRVEKNAGHGAGKPLHKVVEELADTWAFVFDELGIEFNP
ncbi:hypothetical protein CL659_00865 [bacterium]|nr:hypothetical protein [bacterium]|tara:strand:+ start:48912 stop:51977 length:3066 start_codon:yes stop_codon:yes gene_type:complete